MGCVESREGLGEASDWEKATVNLNIVQTVEAETTTEWCGE